MQHAIDNIKGLAKRIKYGSKSGAGPYLTSSEEDELVSF